MPLRKYNVAIGKYKMLSTAKAHATDLAADGWPAIVARTGEPEYYVVIERTDSVPTAAAAARRYAARYPRGTVALPQPIAIIPLSKVRPH